MKRLSGRAAGLVAVQRAPRDQPKDVLRVGERDADRRGAGARDEQDADQRDERASVT
jgi:hypothetical protein